MTTKRKRRFISVDAEMLARKARTPVAAPAELHSATLTAKIRDFVIEKQCQRLERIRGEA